MSERSRAKLVRGGLSWLFLVLVAVVGYAFQTERAIEGAWQAQTYVLKDGTELEVTGLIFFSESDWTVLFFVVDEDGKPRRGSAEGGDYRIEGDQLEFTHFYHLSTGEAYGGLPEAPLRMNVATDDGASTEPCRVELGETQMTIYFPSGNQMSFARRSES